ncbi:YcxB-like protein [Sinobacterium caligoides]|uniref:YcxB-like protein n=1 Tax=Sinobacterium caligoides TaxID=933926 RepID=A0A3N2E1J8_9GAMM|nr:YcxB family protein [Sinobacterium caligoides]ROS05445.1 YcxB-like protein [Sinobacterium caligoides]
MDYQASFVLDKAHFTECFEESNAGVSQKNNYLKAALFLLVAVVMMMIGVDGYVVAIVLSLAALEAASVYYRRGWWVARQMLGRSAGSTVSLTVDDNGVHIHSSHVEQSVAWSELQRVLETNRGVLLEQKDGVKHYLSKAALTTEVVTFMQQQIASDA